jgi:hypothetical protein
MKTSILTTDFNFAKSINLSLIAAPDAYPSYPSGMLDFIKPYLQELQENTIIPDYLTLVSIQTIDNQDAGVHILTFTQNISMTMILLASLALNAYGIPLPMTQRHALVRHLR